MNLMRHQRFQSHAINITTSTQKYLRILRPFQSSNLHSNCNTSHNQRQIFSFSNSQSYSRFGALLLPLLACSPMVALLQESASEDSNVPVSTATSTATSTRRSSSTATATATATATTSGEEDADGKGWVSLYLDEASQQNLRKHFKQDAHENVFAKDMTLQFNPSEEDYAIIADTVGMDNIQIAPIALVTSDTIQVLYCDIIGQRKNQKTTTTKDTIDTNDTNDTNETNGTKDTETDSKTEEKQVVIKFDARIASLDVHPHIVLSATTTTIDRDEVQTILAQVAAASLLDLARNADEFSWSGMLPAIEGGGRSNKIAVQSIQGKNNLTATVCTNFRWDEPTMSCKPPGECGFCKFMRAGPCGDVFTAWEDCIDACKKDESDFVDVCGSQTMALKICVDENPEYYGVLSSETSE